MIPTDLASRLKLLSEPTVQAPAPVRDAASDLPGLVPGMRISARIEALLPNGTMRASVAGHTITLSLAGNDPDKPVDQLLAAGPGQTLNLKVVTQTPRLVIAQLADPENTTTASLSRPGQLIGALLARGDPAPAPLTRGEPLLPTATREDFGQLPARLHQAVSESGLFYESHQVEWLAGQRTTDTLLREPQGSHSPLLQGQTSAAHTPQPGHPAAASAVATATAGAPGAQALAPDNRLSPLPADLTPLVQQQLDAASSGHVMWTGQIWPGQTMEWHVEQDGRGQSPMEEEALPWKTSLRLSLPRLGRIEAAMTLTGAGISLALATDAGTGEACRAAAPALANALEAAGVPLTGLQVKPHEQP